jgi:hypothetical protein
MNKSKSIAKLLISWEITPEIICFWQSPDLSLH